MELLVRCHMRTASLAAPPPGSLLWQVQDDVHQVPMLLPSMPAFLAAWLPVAHSAAAGPAGPTPRPANPTPQSPRRGTYEAKLTVTYADGSTATVTTDGSPSCTLPDERETVC